MSGISGQFGPASSLFSAGTYKPSHARRTTFNNNSTFDDKQSFDSNNSGFKLGGLSLGSTKLKLNQGLKLNLKPDSS